MNSKWLWPAVAVVAIILVGGFLISNKNKTNNLPAQTPSTVSTPSASPEASNTPSTSPSAATNNITIQGSEFSFTPSTVTVKKGEKVKLTFKNSGTTTHDLVIADLNVSTKRIGPGSQDTVEFTPDKTGSFQFVCTVDSHKQQGMIGTLKVE